MGEFKTVVDPGVVLLWFGIIWMVVQVWMMPAPVGGLRRRVVDPEPEPADEVEQLHWLPEAGGSSG